MAAEPKSSCHVGNYLVACSRAGKWSSGGRDHNLVWCGPLQEGQGELWFSWAISLGGK